MEVLGTKPLESEYIVERVFKCEILHIFVAFHSF